MLESKSNVRLLVFVRLARLNNLGIPRRKKWLYGVSLDIDIAIVDFIGDDSLHGIWKSLVQGKNLIFVKKIWNNVQLFRFFFKLNRFKKSLHKRIGN